MSDASNNIRTARLNLGLSQEDLAYRTKCHAMTVSKWERGVLLPRGKKLQSLADALQVTTSYLINKHRLQDGAYTKAHEEWKRQSQEISLGPSPLSELTLKDLQSAVSENIDPYIEARLPPLARTILLQVLTIVLEEAPPNQSPEKLGTLILTAYDQAVEGKRLNHVREKVRMWFS